MLTNALRGPRPAEVGCFYYAKRSANTLEGSKYFQGRQAHAAHIPRLTVDSEIAL
jgi:hypothetical protein